jgi:hypothetical protein
MSGGFLGPGDLEFGGPEFGAFGGPEFGGLGGPGFGACGIMAPQAMGKTKRQSLHGKRAIRPMEQIRCRQF